MLTRKRMIRAEDLYQIELIFDVRLSPDGKHVIYRQQRVDKKTEKKHSNLWLTSTVKGTPRQFTFGEQTDSMPRWSPDSKRIAFLSNRMDADEPAQIFIIPLEGGEARQLTSIDGEIDELSWSPDGSRLLCTVRKIDAEVMERNRDEQKKKLGVVARQYDRLFYKLDGYGFLPHERIHVWLVNARTGKARQCTDHPVWDENNPSLSSDGRMIAFLSNHSADPDLHPDLVDLFVMPVSSRENEPCEAKLIKTPVGRKELPSFSPDGKWIAYYGQEGEGMPFKNNNLWIVPADGVGPARNLTGRYDVHISPSVNSDCGQPELMKAVWSSDSRYIYFPVARHGSSILLRISISDDELQEIIGEGGVVGSFSLDSDQAMMAYFYAQIDDPGQVCLLELNTGRTRQLTRVNRNWLNSVDLGKVEEVWFKGPDGNDLQGWIIFPPDFDDRNRYPSIMEIHGGPIRHYGRYFYHEFYFLASKGFIVYFSNPRGGLGYGEAHARAIWGVWGTADYADLMTWADEMTGRRYIDTARMGVTGGSYGGYMTVWIIGHTDRFKAAVTQRCVSNFISQWGSSDMNWVFEQTMKAGPPFTEFKKWWERSPVAYLGNARTPTLVIHSEGDMRCPIEQGEQVFVALKRLGVATEMVRFPEEFHGLSRTGRTDRRIARLNHILRWFEKYLK